MTDFSISQLARFAGIKPHTIRIWEQRYNALKPHRSEGNTRYYDDLQLRRLLNIVSMMSAGYKISELSSSSDKELSALMQQQQSESEDYYVSQLIAACVAFDEAGFDKIYSHCYARFGMKQTYTDILFPMLTRLGLMWTCDVLFTAQEHFILNLLRQKLFTAIDALPPAKNNAETWLLFLPENEFHEIGLLVAQYLIRLSGQKVIYLGENLPAHALPQAVNATYAKHLFFFFVHNDTPEAVQTYMQWIAKTFPRKKIYTALNAQLLKGYRHPKAINLLHSVNDLEKYLS